MQNLCDVVNFLNRQQFWYASWWPNGGSNIDIAYRQKKLVLRSCFGGSTYLLHDV